MTHGLNFSAKAPPQELKSWSHSENRIPDIISKINTGKLFPIKKTKKRMNNILWYFTVQGHYLSNNLEFKPCLLGREAQSQL